MTPNLMEPPTVATASATPPNPNIFSVDAIAQQSASSVRAQLAQKNQTKQFNYDTSYANALLNQSKTGVFVAPPPVEIESLDATKYVALFIAWSNGLATGAPNMFDYSSAISTAAYSKLAPAPAAPAAPAAPPINPVGAAQGNGYYGVVPGDTTPVGMAVQTPDGTFLKIGNATPFGMEVAYVKVFQGGAA